MSPRRSVTVRRLRPRDAESLMALRRSALESEPSAFLASPEDDLALSPDFVREALLSESQAVFGAFAPKLAGMVGIYRDPHRKLAHTARAWGLYVEASLRRTGAGRALMSAAIRFARGVAGVARLDLGVSADAVAALRLYERLGFTIWGTEPDALRVDGRAVAEHHMSLDLTPRSRARTANARSLGRRRRSMAKR